MDSVAFEPEMEKLSNYSDTEPVADYKKDGQRRHSVVALQILSDLVRLPVYEYELVKTQVEEERQTL